MSRMATAIRRSLAATNGGPGLTAVELADQLGAPVAVVRGDLATLVFCERGVTCMGRDGRYKLGSPDRLLEAR